MRNEDSFDLNHAIQQWRENLRQAPALQLENIDELESHLRDSVTVLQTRGLSTEEAFIIGARRIGQGSSLEKEFGKINGRALWLDRALWMLIGIQVWGLISGLIFSIARNGYAFGWRNINYDWKTNGVALPVTLLTVFQVLAFATSIALCWWLIVRKGRKILAWLAPWMQKRSTFVVTCIAFCLLACFINIVSSGLSTLLVWAYGPKTFAEAMMYSHYAQFWVAPFQIAVMIASTLVLMRKRLRLINT